MEDAISLAFNLFRPFLIAGILTTFCYRVLMAFLNQDPGQGLRLLTWGAAFFVGGLLIEIATDIRPEGARDLVSCTELSHLSSCNGWLFFGSSGKALVGMILEVSGTEYFSLASASLIMATAGLILSMELTKAVWQASAPPIVGAFFTGCLVYVVMTNPGYFLSILSDLLASGAAQDYSSDLDRINAKLSSLEALFDSSKAIESSRGVLQTISEGIKAPMKYLIELFLSLSLMLMSLLNLVFLLCGVFLLSWLPNLVLFSIVMGSFTRWSLVRWLGYVASFKLLVLCQIVILRLLPDVRPGADLSFYDSIRALGDISSALMGSLFLIAAVIAVMIWGSLKLLHLIWLRELLPAVKMGSALKERFSPLPMDRYF